MRISGGGAIRLVPAATRLSLASSHPHATTHSTDRPPRARPTVNLRAANIVAPLESVHEAVGQDDLALDVQLMLGTQQRVGTGLQRDGHLERILHHQSTIVKIRHGGVRLASCIQQGRKRKTNN